MASFPFCGPRRFRLGRVTALASDPNAPVKRYTPPGAEVDSVIDLRAVFQQGHRALKREDLPAFLLPQKGRYDLCGYEKLRVSQRWPEYFLDAGRRSRSRLAS